MIAWGPMGGGVKRDYGPSAVFRVGGIDIVLITNNGQATTSRNSPRSASHPQRYQTVAVKSMHHFRAAFEPIARQIVLVDTARCARRSTRPRCQQGAAADLSARQVGVTARTRVVRPSRRGDGRSSG